MTDITTNALVVPVVPVALVAPVTPVTPVTPVAPVAPVDTAVDATTIAPAAPITPLNFANTPTQITNVIHISDIHIKKLQMSHKPHQRNLTYDIHAEYKLIFNKLFKALSAHPAVVARTALIVIVGDLLHEKGDVDAIANDTLNHLLAGLERIMPTIIINGNHDYKQNMGNEISYLESQASLIGGDLLFLKKSGLYTCANVAIGLLDISDAISPTATRSSIMNEYIPKVLPRNLPPHVDTKIALYHGGVYFDNNDQLSHGINTQSSLKASEYFGEYDIGMFGDIHLQMLSNITPLNTSPDMSLNTSLDTSLNTSLDTPPKLSKDPHVRHYSYNSPAYAYSGSLIQQNFGETIDNHGFLDWNIKAKQVATHNIPNPFSKITIDSIEIAPNVDSSSAHTFVNIKQLGRVSVDEFKTKYPHITTPCIRMGTHIDDTTQKSIYNIFSPSQIQIKPTTVDTRAISSEASRLTPPQLALVNFDESAPSDPSDPSALNTTRALTNTESTMQIIINNLRANPNAADLLKRYDWTAFLSGDYHTLTLSPPTLISPPHISYESALQNISTEIIKRNADINKLIEAARQASDNPLASTSTIQELRIERLEWSYLFSYGRDCYIDFADFSKSIVLINGANDAGKSSIFNILVLALYGETPVKHNKKELMPEAINTSCPRDGRAQSAIHFSINYKAADSTIISTKYLIKTDYIVKVGPPKSITKSMVMYQYSPTKMGYETFINNGNTKSIDAWVESNIGTKENFIMYYIYTQDLDYDFCKISSELKQKTLARLFNPPNLQYIINLIDEAQKAYKHVSRYTKLTIANLKSQIADTQDTLSTADIAQLQAAATSRHADASQQISRLTKLATIIATLVPNSATLVSSAATLHNRQSPSYALAEAEELATTLATNCARITQLEAAATSNQYQFPAAIRQLLAVNTPAIAQQQRAASAPASTADVGQLVLNLLDALGTIADYNKKLREYNSPLIIDVDYLLYNIRNTFVEHQAKKAKQLLTVRYNEYFDEELATCSLDALAATKADHERDSAHIRPQILLKLTPANYDTQYEAATSACARINSELASRRELLSDISAQQQTVADKVAAAQAHSEHINGDPRQVDTVIKTAAELLQVADISRIIDCYNTREADNALFDDANRRLVAMQATLARLETIKPTIDSPQLLSIAVLRDAINTEIKDGKVILEFANPRPPITYNDITILNDDCSVGHPTTSFHDRADYDLSKLSADLQDELAQLTQQFESEHAQLVNKYGSPDISVVTSSHLTTAMINEISGYDEPSAIYDKLMELYATQLGRAAATYHKVLQQHNIADYQLATNADVDELDKTRADLQHRLAQFVDGYGTPIESMDDFCRFEADVARLGTQLNCVDLDDPKGEQLVARIKQTQICREKLAYYRSEEARVLSNIEFISGLKFNNEKCDCCKANREVIMSLRYSESLAEIRAGITSTEAALAAAELSPRDQELAAEYKREQSLLATYSRSIALLESHASASIAGLFEAAGAIDAIADIYNTRAYFVKNSAQIIHLVLATQKWSEYTARFATFTQQTKPRLEAHIEICRRFEQYIPDYNTYLGRHIYNELIKTPCTMSNTPVAPVALVTPVAPVTSTTSVVSYKLSDVIQLFVKPADGFNYQFATLEYQTDQLKLRRGICNRNMSLISEYNYITKVAPSADSTAAATHFDARDYLSNTRARYLRYRAEMAELQTHVAAATQLATQRAKVSGEITTLSAQLAEYDFRDLEQHRATYQRLSVAQSYRTTVATAAIYDNIVQTLNATIGDLETLVYIAADQTANSRVLDELRDVRDTLAANLAAYAHSQLARVEVEAAELKVEGDRLTSLFERSRNNEVITVTNEQKVANLEELTQYSDNFDKFGADIESMYKIIKDLSSQNIRYFAGLISNIVNSLFAMYQHSNERTYNINIDVTDTAASINVHCDNVDTTHWHVGGFYKELLGFCIKIAFTCTSTNAVCRSRTLFADEPFAGGSEESIASIQVFLKQIMAAGYLDTIVMASHSSLRDARTQIINLSGDSSGRTLVRYPAATADSVASHTILPAEPQAPSASTTAPNIGTNDNFAIAATTAAAAGKLAPTIAAAPKTGITYITLGTARVSNLNHYNLARKQCCSALTKSTGALCSKPAANPKNAYSLCATHFNEINKE